EHCPFVVSLDARMRPVNSSVPGATTTTVTGQGFRISAACIATPAVAVLEGTALSERLSMLAATIGVTRTSIKVPAPPAPSCGLIEGEIAPSGIVNKVRTEFCFGPNGYLIVETTTDSTSGADQIVAAVLSSIAKRPNLSKIEAKFSEVES